MLDYNNVLKASKIFSYDAQRTKGALMQFADNAGPDQPAQMRRLIRAFVVRLQN